MKQWKKALILAVVCCALAGCGQAAVNSGQASAGSSAVSEGARTYASDDLHKAAHDGNVEQVKAILATHPDPDARDSFGGTALHAAMFQKDMEIVRLLLDYGMDVNAIGPKNGYTPLHDAVWGNNPEAAKLLLARGADRTIRNKSGQTALEKARSEGKEELVQILELK